ncbi:hypothetical protein FE257_002655 [Aspergillus nanangensis]|uniref:Uncharacterized protein n=1 Tax=Aspergillus nanangensis TaxID=2582783 RepID=A0AAD4CCS3_ASPNN|nr:hypothetical protein FE257_002655 [Aspergillus nanangensis]
MTDDPVDSFDIELAPNDGEGGFHIKNNPRQPFQRATIHEDRRSMNIKCSLIDVVHGRLTPDGEDYATLLVLGFRFDPSKRGDRIISTKITVVFYGEADDDDHPGVAEISLNGSYSLVETTQTETTTSGLEGTIGANVLTAGELSLSKKYEKTVSQETSDSTFVSGATCLIGVDWDPANAAEWKMRENSSRKTGVPSQLRVGVLLKRDSQANFKCTADIESEVDLRSRIGRWLGGKPKDDPVLFNPRMKSTNRLMQYDTDNLGAIDLSLVEDVTFTTVLEGAVKHSQLKSH